MRAVTAVVLAVLALGPRPSDDTASGGWRLVVLGIAQDAGMPHLACQSPPCSEVRAGRAERERVSCLGLVHRPSGRAYLFDATPDLREQVHALTGGRLPDGIFLTHAHIGHYTGLMYLGKESVAARDVPVFATRRMAAFLEANAPWRALVEGGHIALRPIQPDQPLDLGLGVKVTAFQVPHRDELSDTVGYRIEGPRASAVFVPDVDRWEAWDRSIRELADRVDLLFLDGTFAAADEVPGRSLSEIPHPLIPHTRALLAGARGRVIFIHLNHTNRQRGAPDAAREGQEFPL
jgi:pyrroloquinoline quinone biosynthesis protein B